LHEAQGVNALKYIIFCLFLVCTISAFGQDANVVRLDIRFSDQKIYFLGDQINIKITLKNSSNNTFRFKIADYKVFNIDFDVRTTTNIAVPHAEDFISERTTDQYIFYREISLEPSEEYSIVEDLTTYIKFDRPALYIIQCDFYPELRRSNNPSVLKSNKLTLNLRPPVDMPEMRTVIEAETVKELKREALSPDQVVSYTIKARQQAYQTGEWDRFFLYLDLKNLYLQNDVRKKEFINSSEQQQRILLAQYKENLKKEVVDQDILLVPTGTEIVETWYSGNQAQVKVDEYFEYPDFTDKRRYVYYLMKDDVSWLIYKYVVINRPKVPKK
jgi:hypothetical protein